MKKSYVINQVNVFGMINYNTSIINRYIKMHSPPNIEPCGTPENIPKTKKHQQF
jgi:hypothetical protein